MTRNSIICLERLSSITNNWALVRRWRASLSHLHILIYWYFEVSLVRTSLQLIPLVNIKFHLVHLSLMGSTSWPFPGTMISIQYLAVLPPLIFFNVYASNIGFVAYHWHCCCTSWRHLQKQMCSCLFPLFTLAWHSCCCWTHNM